MDELRVWLLGGFRVSVGAREIADDEWRLRKAKSLVKLLALAPAHRMYRDQVIDVLWPELDPAAAGNQLRKALHEARRVLDPDPGATYRYIESGERLGLRRTGVWIDVEAFETAALEARRRRDPVAYQAAIAGYGGDLLPEDRYEDWVTTREEALRTERLSLLIEWSRLLEARGELDGATAALRQVLTADPTHEGACANLMRLCALAGRRHEALRQYEHLREMLDRELGVPPDVTTQRLYEQIKAGRAEQPQLAGELWEQVGDLRVVSGDGAGATSAYRAAIDALRQAPADLHLAGLHRKAAQALLTRHDAAGAEGHLAAVERLLSGEPGGPDAAERGRVLGTRAHWLWEVGRYDDAQAAAEASLDLAERHGTPEDVAAANESLAIVFHVRGAWREGLHVEINRLAAQAGDDQRLTRIFDLHHCIGQYHLYGDGLFDSVEEYARRTLELAIAREARSAEAFAWCLLGESLLLQGRWDEAPGCLERSVEIHAEMGSRSGTLPVQRLAELAVGQGDSDAAAGYLRRGMAIATISPLARHAWGRLYATVAFDAMERDEPEAAIRAVRSAGTAGARFGDCPTCAALLNPMAAEASAALGDRAGTAAYANAAQEVARSFASSAWRAMAGTAAAWLAFVEGDRARARTDLLAGARLYEQARQPFWAARSRLQAALLGGDPHVDRDLITEAAAVFERLGATRRLRMARAAID